MSTVKGFIFDYSKCVGCHACMVACYNENHTTPPLSWRQVSGYNKSKLPLLGFVHLSIACNHCAEAPCLKACPSGAYSIDPQTKAVIHNPDLCIGCKYCTWACPFDAPKYNEETRLIEKCNFCNHRLKEGQIPACALNCPTGALSFGKIDEEPNPNALGLSTRQVFPKLKVLGTDVSNSVPEMDVCAVDCQQSSSIEEYNLLANIPSRTMNWLAEWPLAVFTSIGAFIVGWLWATLFTPSIELSPWVFAGLGAVAVLLSTLHLGRPLRAYMSILNIKTSWLSREILTFGIFMLFGFGSLIIGEYWIVIVASIAGLFFLVSVEKLYSVTRKRYNTPIHSANTITMALVFASLFAEFWNILLVLLVLKFVLFIVRNGQRFRSKPIMFTLVSFVRILLGFLIPIGIITLMQPTFSVFFLSSLILGEVIDRFMFYEDFEPQRPFNL